MQLLSWLLFALDIAIHWDDLPFGTTSKEISKIIPSYWNASSGIVFVEKKKTEISVHPRSLFSIIEIMEIHKESGEELNHILYVTTELSLIP